MAQMIQKNRGRYKGIWHLSQNALDELDNMISESWKELQKLREFKIKEEVDQRKKETNQEKTDDELKRDVEQSYKFDKNDLQITVEMSNGQKFNAKFIKDISEDPSTKDLAPISLKTSITTESVQLKMDIEENYSYLESYPEAEDLANKMFFKFENWLTNNKLNNLFCVWRDYIFVMMPTMVLSLICLTLLISFNVNKIDKNNLSIKAKILLNQDISEFESKEALKLLLTDRFAPNIEREISWKKKNFLFFLIFFFLCLPIFFPPRNAIAIGKGVKSVKNQKKWLYFLLKILPSFIVLGVLASIVGSYIYGKFTMP